MSLMNDDNADEIRFQLPMCVGERYGEPIPELQDASAPSAQTRVRVTADIQTSGRIKSISSPSHSDELTETRYPTHVGRPSRRRTTVKYRSSSFLERDFVLIVSAENLNKPRCFAELEGNPEESDAATLAMQLTIIPNFDLASISTQEYVFLIDRSGSMSGSRIDTAKSTLVALLRMLPSNGTLFNVTSFGSRTESLWPRSQRYAAGSLENAVSNFSPPEHELTFLCHRRTT